MNDNEWNVFFREAQESQHGYSDFPDGPEESDCDAHTGMNGSDEGAKEEPEQNAESLLEFPSDIVIDTNSDDIIQDLFGPKDLVAIYGLPGEGKTFVSLDAMMRVAHGLPVGGRRTRQAAILIVTYEGKRGIRKRIKAAVDRYGDPGKMFALLRLRAPLDRSRNGAIGAKTIVAAIENLKATSGCDTAIVVIDTFSRAIAGDDDNSATDVTHFVEVRASKIADATDAAIIVIHHPGKDVSKGPRGSSALLGAADACLLVHEKTVTIEKSKEAESGAWFSFQLRRVVLGQNDHDEEISTCVVDEIGAPPEQEKKKPKLSESAEKILPHIQRLYENGDALSIASEKLNIKNDGDMDAGEKWLAVTIQMVRETYRNSFPSDEERPNDVAQVVRRGIENLQKHGVAIFYGDYIALTSRNSPGKRASRKGRNVSTSVTSAIPTDVTDVRDAFGGTQETSETSSPGSPPLGGAPGDVDVDAPCVDVEVDAKRDSGFDDPKPKPHRTQGKQSSKPNGAANVTEARSEAPQARERSAERDRDAPGASDDLLTLTNDIVLAAKDDPEAVFETDMLRKAAVVFRDVERKRSLIGKLKRHKVAIQEFSKQVAKFEEYDRTQSK